MRNKNYMKVAAVCAMGVSLWLASCTQVPPTIKKVAILPQPASIQQDTTFFTLPKSCKIGISDPKLQSAAEYLSSILTPSTGYNMSIVNGEGDINLTLDASIQGKEGAYVLTSNPKSVKIAGSTERGVICGIQSLRQLFPVEIESKQKVDMSWGIPTVTIKDSPRFDWRGIMLDVSRHFYNVDEVKELMDVMALYKMNKLHMHLTDDQGWRIEIKKYPKLTEKGGWRIYNNQDSICMRRAKEEDNVDMRIPENKLKVVEGDTLYGGYYTQEDIKKLVNYGLQRGIDIVPELDMPGHMLAAVSNYEGVSCFKTTGWGSIFSSPVCPGKESAMTFCKNVYKEVIGLFPYKYIHIGGDEVEKTNWKKCPDCQKRMKEEGLKTPEELQSWFIHEMEHFFNENGRQMIGWDEILEGGLSKTASVMWWRSWAKDAPARTMGQGNKMVFTPNGQFYLDYGQDKFSVSKIYNYDPMVETTNKEMQKLVQGVQGNTWTEWIPTRERMHYQIFPRALGIAELGWSTSAKDWNGFETRMVDQFDRLNVLNINYRLPDLECGEAVNAFIDEAEVKISCIDRNVVIRYTTDGSMPTMESKKYEGSLKVNETTNFTFRSFHPNGKPSDVMKVKYVKSTYAPAVTAAPSNPGLQATWYDYRGDKCTEIETAAKKGTYRIEDVVIPKAAKGNIGLIIKGYVNVPKDDIYTFILNSDDGSTLKVDNELIVDNDGPHAPVQLAGQKALKAGYHPIEVRYFDHNGGMLEMTVKGSDKKVIPYTYLYAH